MEAMQARALLARVPELTAADLTALLAAADGEVARAVEPRARRTLELRPAARAFLAAPDEAALTADLAWLAASGARLMLCTDADYPPLLRQAGAPPAALYLLGSAAALAAPQLAMVGSRSPTPAGRATAREFAKYFAHAGLAVTSGLSAGIDAASHEGALAAGGLTVAVCAGGLERIYPAENAALAARIRAHGALVSEFSPGTPARREHFARRNRIIAALSLGTLVVEAARGADALGIARLAGEQGREVFAIPGSIHSPLSRGCHQLIREGAKLVEEAADVLAELRISVPKETLTAPVVTGQPRPELDKEYEMLLDALGFEPATAEVLAARAHLPGESVASMLLILELQGRVAALPGGRYGRITLT